MKAQGLQVQAVLPGITRTEIWERNGMDDSALPASMIMEVGEMVDAALAGFDQGELITIPSLPAASWCRTCRTAARRLVTNKPMAKTSKALAGNSQGFAVWP